MRLFIALPIQLSSTSLDELSYIKSELNGYKIKWEKNENLHITLHFIGETEPAQVKDIQHIVKNILSSKQVFILQIRGLETFGEPEQPRIIWLDVLNKKELTRIALEINKQLSDSRFGELSKKYKAHLTIGRIFFCNLAVLSKLEELKERYKNYCWENKSIPEIKLYQSTIKSHRAVYKIMRKFTLNN